METWVMSIITKFSAKHPRPRFVYAVTGGKYLGELLIYAKSDNSDYYFLTLPEMKSRIIPKEKFNFAIQEGIVETVQKIPKDVYNVCLKQHAKSVAFPPQVP